MVGDKLENKCLRGFKGRVKFEPNMGIEILFEK